MDFEEPRSRPDKDVLVALARQDLDPLSVSELDERIAALEAEIRRTAAKRDAATLHRQSAEALFRR